MKKITTMLAALLLATTFAAGCSKMKECKEANDKDKKTCETNDNYDPKKACSWDDNTKKCTDKQASPAATAACATHNADEAACKAVTKDAGGQADAKCVWDDKATPNKCKAVIIVS